MAVGGQKASRKSFRPSSLSSPSIFTLTSWATRSGREPKGTSLREGHRSLGVRLASGARQPDRDDVIRATALEGHGLVFLGRVPTPTAACLVSSCPAGWDQLLQKVGHGQARRAWPRARADAHLAVVSAPLPGLWAPWAWCLCGRCPRRQ